MPIQALVALIAKIFKVVLVVRYIKMRQLCFTKFKGNITSVSNKLSVF